MPLQSKVNDLLMQVFMERLMKAARREVPEKGECTEELLDTLIRATAGRMGLSARVEQFESVTTTDVRGLIAFYPMLFVGYYFYAESDWVTHRTEVRVMCDVPRMCSQLPYPSQEGYRIEKSEHDQRMALKLAGVALASGVWPTEQRAAWHKLLDGAKAALRKVADGVSVAEQLAESQFAGFRLDIKSARALAALLNETQIRRIWMDKASMELVAPSGVPMVRKVRKVQHRPLELTSRQIVENVGTRRAGRPPRLLKNARKELLRNLRAELTDKGGDLKALSKTRRRQLAYYTQLEQDDDSELDGETDNSDYSEYESDVDPDYDEYQLLHRRDYKELVAGN